MNTTHSLPELKICKRCILPETFPGIKFDEQGVCKYCLREEASHKKVSEKKEDYKNRLDELIKKVRDKAPSYDAIMAFSGGKDSSYTLKLLKEKYNLRILAFTFDNHFVSKMAWDNIKKVTDELEVDLVSFKLPWPLAQKIFSLTAKQDIFPRPTLLRASSVCTACIGLVKSLVLKTALELSIPLVAFGWSPGQAPIQSAIMKTNPELTKKNQSALKKAFPADISESMKSYFIPDIHFDTCKDRFPHNIHPLAFFEYNEEDIKNELIKLGWQTPTDTDTNSSNCLLNAYANHCHIKRLGFHPYVWEIANMVRQGVMDRKEGIGKIYTDQNLDMVEFARNQLN